MNLDEQTILFFLRLMTLMNPGFQTRSDFQLLFLLAFFQSPYKEINSKINVLKDFLKGP